MKAFSLIELMVVIAIVAILAASSAVVYQEYRLRAELHEIVIALEKLAKDEIEYYNLNGQWRGAGSIPYSTNYTDVAAQYPNVGFFQYALDNGGTWDGRHRPHITASTITLGSDTSNYLALVCDVADGVIDCRCRTANSGSIHEIPSNLLPSSCQCNEAFAQGCNVFE